MKVAIYGQRVDVSFENYINPFFEKLQKEKIDFLVEENFAKQLSLLPLFNNIELKTFSSYEDLDNSFGLFFTFGGDGTILSAVQLIQDHNIPIVGINTGRLGFLATFSKAEFLEKLDAILQGNYITSERSLLQIETNNVKIPFNFALNEIAVIRKETTSMITVDAKLNDELLNTFWADGLIISTPTGSTGYSLSCGGPIVSPENHCLIVTPIAPHNLNVRPFITSDTETLYLKVSSRVPEYSLTLDSRLISLGLETELIVKKANFTIKIVQENKTTYLKTLHQKLGWGTDSRN